MFTIGPVSPALEGVAGKLKELRSAVAELTSAPVAKNNQSQEGIWRLKI